SWQNRHKMWFNRRGMPIGLPCLAWACQTWQKAILSLSADVPETMRVLHASLPLILPMQTRVHGCWSCREICYRRFHLRTKGAVGGAPLTPEDGHSCPFGKCAPRFL